MRFRGRRVIHTVMAAVMLFTFLPNSAASAQPPITKNPELTTNPRITASPSPPPNPLDINLLDLMPGKRTFSPSKDSEAIAQPSLHSNINEPINTPQSSPASLPLSNPNELNSANPMFNKENLVQSQEYQAPLVPQASSYTEPTTDSQITPNPLPILNPYELVSVEVTPDKEGILQSKDSKVKVTFPIGAVTEKVRVEYKEQRPWESTGMRMVRLFELNGFAVDRGNAAVKTFSKQLQVSITHSKEELAGLDTRSLRLYYLDETQKRWLPVTGQYNIATRTLTSSTDHFTYYGEQANPSISGPGTVMNFQVGLQSGTAVARYLIELPPGPGGFQPKVELVYNSGSVDEMKNKRALGSWVGIGWSLNLGRVVANEEDSNSFLLELNGEAYQLNVNAADGSYYTTPDGFLKIIRTGHKWEIWDKSGTYYRFGGTSDSELYHDKWADESGVISGPIYYRWELNLMRDPHGNEIKVSYVWDFRMTYEYGYTVYSVRSANPEYLRYNFDQSGNNLVEICFIPGYDIQNDPTDGNLRTDSPRSTTGNKSPTVMETMKLTDIEVRAGPGNPLPLVRKYSFAYTTTASTQSSDYGGIYYSGAHVLDSITQKGANGASLPAVMRFYYQNKDTRLEDSYNPQYVGNPGNPAVLSWPHLWKVDNGFGGIVEFTYSEKPSSTVKDMWTREVVATRKVTPGIGPDQTSTYDYTGNPRYTWHSWNARFKGFEQVKETDAAGNFTQHYFYTTGPVNGKDADKLSGKEWKTEWYTPGTPPTLLKQAQYDWLAATAQGNKYAFVGKFDSPDNGDGNFQTPSGVATYFDGTNTYVYVADPENGSLQKFSSSGNFLAKWKRGTGDSDLSQAWGVAVDAGGNVYALDDYQVKKFDSAGAFLLKWGQFANARGIAVDTGGNVYVVESYASRIQKFTSSGTYLGQWGSYGTGNGQFAFPSGIVYNSVTGSVYIADTANNRVQIFSTTGAYLGQFGTSGSGDGQLSSPWGVTADSQGNIYVADTNNSRIQKFTASGAFVAKWNAYGSQEGQFNYPRAIALDSSGNIYVGDSWNHRVQKFTGSMGFSTLWGNHGLDSGRSWSPKGLSWDGSSLFVADSLNDRVYKFDPYGTQTGRWGSYIPGAGSFSGASGIGVDANYFYVADLNSSRIIKLNKATGALVAQWGGPGSGNGQFQYLRDVAADNNGYIYVADTGNNRVQKLNAATGDYVLQIGASAAQGVGVDSRDPNNIYVYVADTGSNTIQKYRNSGAWVTGWSNGGSGWSTTPPLRVAVDGSGNVYVVSQNGYIRKFTGSGTSITQWSGNEISKGNGPQGVAIRGDDNGNDVYVAYSDKQIQRFAPLWAVQLSQVDENTGTGGGAKTARTNYSYDSYGNVIKVERRGDTSITTDDSTVYTVFNANTTAWILNKPYRERVYSGIKTSDDGVNLIKEALFYYDCDDLPGGTPCNLNSAPSKGDIGRADAKIDAATSVITYYGYDSYGNQTSIKDPRGNTTTFTYDSTNRALPITKTLPLIGAESYTWDYGSGRILTETDVNGQVTSVEYDTFKRPVKIIRPGDSSGSPTILHEYVDWGVATPNLKQHVKTTLKIDAGNGLWSKRYFDGLGRVVQVQAQGETEGGTTYTIINSTTAFNNRGLADKEYLSQKLAASGVTQYVAPDGDWKYTSYVYDGLSRATTTTKPDATTITHDFSAAWQDTATNERGKQKKYYSDAFGRLVKVEELNDSQSVYAATNYTYDALDNLKTVTDALSNVTTINYDWLSRKISMTDPDMGGWSYTYDANSNLLTQTDAKSQIINFTYDALNRLTCKSSAASCSGTIYASYTYDSASGGNYGKGLRTRMDDASGYTEYTYDSRGRTIKEIRSITGDTNYTTRFTLDSADRLKDITYPGGEVVTQTYNGRGLPNSLSSSISGNLVNSALYNQLGQQTEINLGNNILKMTFGYWGVGGTYDNAGGYYSRLWEIKTFKPGFSPHQDVQHTWDAGGNLSQRVNVVDSETENFQYDFLDRLTAASATTGAPITNGLVGRWNLDEGSGPTAADSSGNGNNGTLTNGPVWVDGKYGKALQFDGVNDYVDAGNGATLNWGTGGFTVELWAKISGVSTDFTHLVSKPYNYWLDLGSGANAGKQVAFYMNTGSNYSSGYAELTGNVWHHIAGVGDNTDKSLKIYVDGVLRNSGAFTGSPTPTTNNLVIGALAGARYVNGVIDEVRIYNRSLSGDEIGKLYSLYSERYTYSAIGNIASKDGVAYSYGTKPHAVTQVGSTNYVYDANGNMTNRGAQALTWDVENRPATIGNTSFVYDGDGKRVKKVEGGTTTVYVNKYYEKTGTEITLYYYLGNRMVALKKGTNLRFVSQDHLTGTSVTSDATTGNLVASIKYAPFGDRRNSTGVIDTDRQFTGQRLDGTGLYYYKARYYDPGLGRFASPDSLVQMGPSTPDIQLMLAVSYSSTSTLEKLIAFYRDSDRDRQKGAPLAPELLNRYSYASNNPLKYNDDSGNWIWAVGAVAGAAIGFASYVVKHDSGDFQWRDAARWAAGGFVIGGTLGAAAPVVAALLLTPTAAGTAVTTAVTAASSPVGQRAIQWTNDFSKGGRVYHIVGQPSHSSAWNQIVKLSGDLKQDYKTIQPFAEIAIRTGKGELEVLEDGQRIWTFLAEIEGKTIEVHAREAAEEVIEIVDAFVRTK